MGVLDDAIREHLELKRKHGAPEGEIEQQAQEALGAPQRRQAEPEAGEPGGPEADGEPSAAAGADTETQRRADADGSETVRREYLDEPAPQPFEEEDGSFADAADPAPDAVEAPPEPESPGDTPPRGFAPVDEPPVADGEEDVLEETPDFLQETPEHDRLWFEQKPPRDFDFDE